MICFSRFGSHYMDQVDIQLEMDDGIVVDSTVKYQGEGKTSLKCFKQ